MSEGTRSGEGKHGGEICERWGADDGEDGLEGEGGRGGGGIWVRQSFARGGWVEETRLVNYGTGRFNRMAYTVQNMHFFLNIYSKIFLLS